jgi:hypothetical protein
VSYAFCEGIYDRDLPSWLNAGETILVDYANTLEHIVALLDPDLVAVQALRLQARPRAEIAQILGKSYVSTHCVHIKSRRGNRPLF